MYLLNNQKLINDFSLGHIYILNKITGWIICNAKKKVNLKKNKYWTFSSIKNMQKRDFTFFSINTIKNHLKDLERAGIIFVDRFNYSKSDRTKWYSVNFDLLHKLYGETKPSFCEELSKSEVALACPEPREEAPPPAPPTVPEPEVKEKSVKNQIELDLLLEQYTTQKELVMSIYNIIVETVENKAKEIKIGKDIFKASLVKQRLRELNLMDIQYAIEIYQNTKYVYNAKAFFLKILFNAKIESEIYYKNLVNKHLYKQTPEKEEEEEEPEKDDYSYLYSNPSFSTNKSYTY